MLSNLFRNVYLSPFVYLNICMDDTNNVRNNHEFHHHDPLNSVFCVAAYVLIRQRNVGCIITCVLYIYVLSTMLTIKSYTPLIRYKTHIYF